MITKNFSIEELYSTTHIPILQNVPPVDVAANLGMLAALCLQPLRDYMQTPVIITSGYRCAWLNRKVGGVSNSYHLRGLAADIHIESRLHARIMFDFLKDLPCVDSVLFEHGRSGSRWLHVQISNNPRHLSNWNYIAD